MHTFFQKKEFFTSISLLVLLFFIFLPGCASNQVVGEAVSIEEEISDPFEDLNRNVFVFNEFVDDYIAQPISDTYKWIAPEFVQIGIGNFFNNLDDINVILNDVMQGKMAQSGADSGRFLANSVFGLLGLFDVATTLGLEKHEEDFAQTLAVWGVPSGPYLIVPVLGPMTTRGIPGGLFDIATNPASYTGLLSIQFVQMLNARAIADGALTFIDEAALDPYVFTRESFLQYRQHLIRDGKSESNDDFLDLEDDFYLDDEEMSDELENSHSSTDKAQTSENLILAKTLSKTVDSKLKSSIKGSSFEQASVSFDNAINLFNKASRSFEEASAKLDRLISYQ